MQCTEKYSDSWWKWMLLPTCNQPLADVGKRALEVAEQAREKKKQKKEQKLKKEEEEEEKSSESEEDEEEVGGRELPSVKSDTTLAGIAAKVKEWMCLSLYWNCIPNTI